MGIKVVTNRDSNQPDVVFGRGSSLVRFNPVSNDYTNKITFIESLSAFEVLEVGIMAVGFEGGLIELVGVDDPLQFRRLRRIQLFGSILRFIFIPKPQIFGLENKLGGGGGIRLLVFNVDLESVVEI